MAVTSFHNLNEGSRPIGYLVGEVKKFSLYEMPTTGPLSLRFVNTSAFMAGYHSGRCRGRKALRITRRVLGPV